jgi:hypothetical protein
VSESDKLWRAMYGMNKKALTFRERVRFWIGRVFPKYKIARVEAKREPSPIIPVRTRADLVEMWDSVTRGIDG